MYSTKGWKALTLKYRTQIPLSDVPGLRKEADEIWNLFQVDADHGNYEGAIIMANAPETGAVITANRSFNFVYEKKDGIWHAIESTNDKTLDENHVREFLDRFDWLLEHGDMNAMLLYLDKNWTFTVKNSRENSVDQKVFNRIEFATIEHNGLLKSKTYRHQRVITEIKIANGNSAHVLSHEIEDWTMNGQKFHAVSDSSDDIAFDGRIMLITKSATALVQQTSQKSD